MKLTFLGTGTSTGVPMVGCDCPVCTSDNPKNKRWRTSVYLTSGDAHILVDTTPEFREQALRYRVPRIDAVLFTHHHADHIFGFDDIRRYNTMQDCAIPAHASPETMKELKRIFDYVGTEKVKGFYRPRIDFRETDGAFDVAGLRIEPLTVEHGTTPTQGYLFTEGERSLAYVPDCSAMSDELISRLKGIDVVVLDGLRNRPHPSHLTIEDSTKLLQQIGARESYIVHICHDIDHDETDASLPDGIRLAYDGLVLEL